MTPTTCNECMSRAWLIRDLSPYIETAIADAKGSRARDLLALRNRDLAEALAPREAARLLSRAEARDPAELRASVERSGAWAYCAHHRSYPGALRPLSDHPAVLFGLGDAALLERLKEPCVTVVGARRPTAHGRELATRLGCELGAAGLPVVSGMALGIDSCAHRGALEAGGMTVAVLGSGPDVPHPARMRRLHGSIAERGLVLAELPPGTHARRWTFPARNRIMAALGAMTVVVEARGRSGSLITSTMAQDLGKEVGAVPGQVGGSLAVGTNQLLHEGAHVIRGAEDVLDALIGIGMVDQERSAESPTGPPLDESLAAALETVERGASTPDAVAWEGGLPGGSAAAALARLELMGYLAVDSSGRYTRTPLTRP